MDPADSLVLAVFILMLVVITYMIFNKLQGKMQAINAAKKNIPGVPTPGRIIPGVPTPGRITPVVPTPGRIIPVVPTPGGITRRYNLKN